MQARRSAAGPAVRSRELVSVRATAAPVAPPAPKKAMKPRKDALYLFQWHRQASDSTAEGTIKQLKALEKVSKDAVWFSVKESEGGGAQHVLVVTSDAKTAKKYQLQELEGDAPLPVTLEGLPEPVQVPVPSIRAALLQRLAMAEDSSDSSDSDEDDCPTTTMPTKMAKVGSVLPELPQTVEENPMAAQQAAALLSPKEGHGEDAGGAAEVVLGMVAKDQRRKLKDAVRDVEKGMHGDAKPMAAPTAGGMMMEDESSSSSSCSSESDEEDMGMDSKMRMKEQEKKEKEERKRREKEEKRMKKEDREKVMA